MTSVAAAPSVRAIALAAVADFALVVVFALIGRASHGETLTIAGIAETAWPFLAGLAVGWLVTFAWRAPLAPVRTGVGVWAITVVGGMLLRAVSGQGVALAFVIVAGAVLVAFLVGWRAIAALTRRRRG